VTAPAAVVRAGLDATGRGSSAADAEYLSDPGRTVSMFAELLGRLHAIPIDTIGPGVPVLGARDVAAALSDSLGARPAVVHVTDPAYRHLPVARLAEVLRDGAEAVEATGSRVLTHGSCRVAALRVEVGRPLGLSGWQHAAVADPCRDLATALRSLVGCFGPGVVPAFMASYPHPTPSAPVLDWFVLADVLAEAAGEPVGGAAP